ncbi:hypothetical protein HU200_019875 [Digitaria exilis]|uniref:Uncharacterized protein n=1 Tax=Digitaria exilis TaxID=1010633 RepID=A0A835KHH4_9POAL|nr:hypothetical protein HU200_019875 [Digitaria exilis]
MGGSGEGQRMLPTMDPRRTLLLVTRIPSHQREVRDAGNLLTRAGLSPFLELMLISIPSNTIVLWNLLNILRAMGENKLLSFKESSNYKGPFFFAQVIYMTGWREHPSQQQAKRRGSATISFSDIQKQFGPNEN